MASRSGLPSPSIRFQRTRSSLRSQALFECPIRCRVQSLESFLLHHATPGPLALFPLPMLSMTQDVCPATNPRDSAEINCALTACNSDKFSSRLRADENSGTTESG